MCENMHIREVATVVAMMKIYIDAVKGKMVK